MSTVYNTHTTTTITLLSNRMQLHIWKLLKTYSKHIDYSNKKVYNVNSYLVYFTSSLHIYSNICMCGSIASQAWPPKLPNEKCQQIHRYIIIGIPYVRRWRIEITVPDFLYSWLRLSILKSFKTYIHVCQFYLNKLINSVWFSDI